MEEMSEGLEISQILINYHFFKFKFWSAMYSREKWRKSIEKPGKVEKAVLEIKWRNFRVASPSINNLKLITKIFDVRRTSAWIYPSSSKKYEIEVNQVMRITTRSFSFPHPSVCPRISY